MRRPIFGTRPTCYPTTRGFFSIAGATRRSSDFADAPALLSDRDIAGEREGHRYGDAPPTWTTPGSAPALRIPSAEKTNAEAERLYRLALAIDPFACRSARPTGASVGPAQSGCGSRRRIEDRSGRKSIRDRGVLAHLVAGRAAQSMGQTHEAARHYQDAAALFPDAQSALLASSLALLGADVPATLAPVQRLGAQSGVFTADPWWQYHLGAGRDADDLLKALWASVPR